MAYLVRTPSSAGNRRTFTMSVWIKPNVQSSTSISMFSAWSADNVASHFVWRINSNGTIGWSRWSEDSYSTRQLRDTNAWYHCVIAVDTTQATASDRIKLYVNNEQITSFSIGANYPAQDTEFPVNNTNSQTIGLNNYSSSGNNFKGYMSHFNLVDGLQLTPSAFGQYDANGVWTIKTSPSVTYGTNGFFVLKDGNSSTDQSGNSNDFTTNGTLTKTEDNPSNVFCTVNPLTNPSVSYSNGNLSLSGGDDVIATLGVTSGKWYWEIKATNATGGRHFGIASTNSASGSGSQFYLGTNTDSSYIWFRDPDISVRNGTGISNCVVTDNSSGINNGDIIGITLDLDNATKKITYYQNGSEIGNVTFDYDGVTPVFPFFRMNSGVTCSANFGNGYFGTTAVASAGTNASGNGIFEYDVPTGYTALSTKGLNL